MAWRAATARSGVAPGAVLAGLLPRGSQHCGALRRYFDALLDGAWPDRPRLQLCAVDLGTGRRAVLDAGSGASPGEAVAASCAIPGLYAPVRIGDRDYVDGAVHSVNNADVATADADLVIVSSPLSIDRYLRRRRPLAALRNAAHAQAERECRSLERDDGTVVLFEPSTPVAAAMGANLNDVGRRSAVARHAYATATELLSRTAVPAFAAGRAGGRPGVTSGRAGRSPPRGTQRRRASHTRCGERGRSRWRTPRWASASTTAFCTAGGPPIVPDSAMPLTPSGLLGDGVSVSVALERRQVGGGREAVVGEGGRERVAVVVVDELLEQRLGDALGRGRRAPGRGRASG